MSSTGPLERLCTDAVSGPNFSDELELHDVDGDGVEFALEARQTRLYFRQWHALVRQCFANSRAHLGDQIGKRRIGFGIELQSNRHGIRHVAGRIAGCGRGSCSNEQPDRDIRSSSQSAQVQRCKADEETAKADPCIRHDLADCGEDRGGHRLRVARWHVGSTGGTAGQSGRGGQIRHLVEPIGASFLEFFGLAVFCVFTQEIGERDRELLSWTRRRR